MNPILITILIVLSYAGLIVLAIGLCKAASKPMLPPSDSYPPLPRDPPSPRDNHQ